MQKVEKHTISKTLNDSSMYGIMFIVAVIFTNILLVAFMLPITKSFGTYFPDVEAYLIHGYSDSRVIYTNFMSIVSSIPQLVGYIFFICMFMAVALNIVKKDLSDFKAHWLKYLIIIAIASFIMYSANNVVSIIYLMLGITSTSSNQLLIYAMLNSSCCVPTIILVVVAAPIVEEIIYRKLMFGFFEETLHCKRVVTILLSATLFSLLHCLSGLDQLIYFPLYFVMALPLVLAYSISNKNMFVTIGIHMINNLISVLLWALLM